MTKTSHACEEGGGIILQMCTKNHNHMMYGF